jgi:hypothetical protein
MNDRIIRKPSGLLSIVLVGLLFSGITVVVAFVLPYAVDWHWAIRPGTLAMLHGESPYEVAPSLGCPPWALLPFLPLAILPDEWGRAVLFTLSLSTFAYSIWKLGARKMGIIAFILSPPILHSLKNGNLDWLPLLGFTLPPWMGLFFVTVKPQMGSIVVLFWLVEAWRQGGIRKVARDFYPIVIVTLITFALYGFWPSQYWYIYNFSKEWNASLWPISLPIGFALLVAALRRREIKFAMAASPCLSPYVLFHAWSGALASLASQTTELIAAVIGLWILVVIPFVKFNFL